MLTAQEFAEKHKLSLNDQQLDAVQHTEGPILLLAVPGSGKTTSLVSRLGYMITECGIEPENILTMTYTVSAAKDMKQRFIRFFGSEIADRLEFRTINSVCVRIIRSYERMYNRTAFKLIQPGQQTAIIGNIYKKHSGNFATDSIVKTLLLHIGYAKNFMMNGPELDTFKLEDGVKFRPIFEEYNATLLENKLMDFDDQLRYDLQILQSRPKVLEVYQERYRYICVDESQDTSKIQHKIIRLLAKKYKNLFMVGDEDQSIYAFRAAYPEALMNFSDEFPEAKTLLLEQNYRSTPAIVNAADLFIRQNKHRHLKHMIPVKTGGCRIIEIECAEQDNQLEVIEGYAQTVRSETAILYRNNSSALPIIDMLDKNGIPFRCKGMDGMFFSSPIVRDFSNIIRLIYNPMDYEAFLSVYPRFGMMIKKQIAMDTVKKASRIGKTPFDILKNDDFLPIKFRVVARRTLEHLQLLKKLTKADKIVSEIYEFWFEDCIQNFERGYEKISALRLIGRNCTDGLQLIDRLEELECMMRQDTINEDAPLILSTIHSSKGLEYERVIMVDVVDGILPFDPMPISKEDEKTLEEDRRTFYVGMTRAKTELILLNIKTPDKKGANNLQYKKSTFINQVLAYQKIKENNP